MQHRKSKWAHYINLKVEVQYVLKRSTSSFHRGQLGKENCNAHQEAEPRSGLSIGKAVAGLRLLNPPLSRVNGEKEKPGEVRGYQPASAWAVVFPGFKLHGDGLDEQMSGKTKEGSCP